MLNQIQQATVTFSSDGREKVSFGANCRSIRFDKSGTENTLGQIKLRVCNANNFVTNYITPKEGMQINGIDFDACEVEGTGACGVILTVSTGSFSGGGGAGAALPKEPVFDSVKATKYAEVGDTAARRLFISPDGITTYGGINGNGDYSSDGIYLTRNDTEDTNRITSALIELKVGYSMSTSISPDKIYIQGNNGGRLTLSQTTIHLFYQGNNVLKANNITGFESSQDGGTSGISHKKGTFNLFNSAANKSFSIILNETNNTLELNGKHFEMRVDTTVTPNRLIFEAI